MKAILINLTRSTKQTTELKMMKPEMDHFKFLRGRDGADDLGYVTLRHHRSNKKRMTENADWRLDSAVNGYAALGLTHLEIVALGSLLELYNAVNYGRNLTRAISKMRKILEELIDTDHGKLSEVFIEGIHLASVYSDALEYEVAESLLSRIVPKLERLSDARFGIEEAYGYMEYGCLHQRKQRWGDASDYLDLAQDGLSNLGLQSDPFVETSRPV